MAAPFRLNSLIASAVLTVSVHGTITRSPKPVEITGEFFKNGTCQVAADGVPLFAPAEQPRALYESGRGSNVAPKGYVLHEIFCSPLRHGIPTLAGDRLFSFSFAVKGEGPATPGTYLVREHAAMRSAPMTIAGSYLDPRHYAPGTPGAPGMGFGGKVFLIGVSGTASFSRLGQPGVVGQFRFQAVRRWSM